MPSDWTGDRVLLNFEAVDYEATVYVNGRKAGFNRGGYFAFTLDITSLLRSGSNELYDGIVLFEVDHKQADDSLGLSSPMTPLTATLMSFPLASKLSGPPISSTRHAVVFGRACGLSPPRQLTLPS